MDGWVFKTNLVCSPPSENIDNGWMMMMMNDDDDDNDDSSFLSRVLMEMETNGIPYLRFILELAEACSFAHIHSALT